ncbi:MAG: hypothetical protein RLZZ303_3329 [Candidatus Hydrogenedentota bacterium]|jgi:cob(I)alamin adenosyltransferase
MASIFTTKKGDGGETRLLSGERVSKSHPIVRCTGALDRCRASLAEARLMVEASGEPGAEQHAQFLFWVLHVCFLIGTEVNDPLVAKPEYRAGTVDDDALQRLEAEQARIEAMLNLPRAFIVTATNPVAARLDVVATQVRDFERELVALAEAVPGFNAAPLLAFVNRLSDYLVALARALEAGRHQPVDYGVLARGH